MLSLKSLHDEMLQDGVNFCFTGFMSEEMILGVGQTLKKKFELEEMDKKTSRDLFSIFIEMSQNVVRYSAKNQAQDVDPITIDLRYGALSIGEKDGHKFIACGNLICNEHASRLENNLNEIRKLDAAELKALFKEKLRNETPEYSKGAGVGMIEIARRARKGFDFSFEDANESKKFFTITAYI
ncbi:SiaB family protein kinase [Terasakiella sp. A23]|uniref:SiaB family protein kinase n=1 Tax=Terasakiella sp. FCG-A23 TaxID=3080561 RepID=UPI002955BB25|nr:SiaB family protein kinase [Terasakiella sp. A23]MDV7338914.1 SiaB family protein kinase [Terasakiella sp. A23]